MEAKRTKEEIRELLESIPDDAISEYLTEERSKKVFDDDDDIIDYLDKKRKKIFDDDYEIIDYVKDDLDKKVFDDDDEIVNYIEENTGYVVTDVNSITDDTNRSNHPRDYKDTHDVLREHLINILGMGHYVTDSAIITKVTEILNSKY